MKIGAIETSMAESLTNVLTVALPAELAGLRHLPVGDHNPQVSIRYRDGHRKVREDADASYFDPDKCELVISFVPIESAPPFESPSQPGSSQQEEPAAEFDWDQALDQLIDQLRGVESGMPFVALKWFRDQFLPSCGLEWAADPRKNGALLRRATEERLVLTSQVPNTEQPLHPVTAIRTNGGHPRFQSGFPGRPAGFTPVRVQGGPVSATVIGDRR